MTLLSVYNASAEIAAAADYPGIGVMGVAMIENDWFEQVELSGVRKHIHMYNHSYCNVSLSILSESLFCDC